MRRLTISFLALTYLIASGSVFADDRAPYVGTWKVISLITKFEAGDTVEFFGPNPKGRLVLTSDNYWSIILTRANRSQAKTVEEKAALLDSMLAYSGKYTIDGDRITTRVDMSWNEIYTDSSKIRPASSALKGTSSLSALGKYQVRLGQGKKPRVF